ncbi:heavy metal-binding domain-containing protein [Plasticicumulans sp.]|uniref:heavy metal-binding domain-containing protein n=1 Tax=Plasticicumulans sp. TaxID=2307179 RepID=UPI00394F89B9
MSTTPTLEGRIREYRGIVNAEAILGANVVGTGSPASTSSAGAAAPTRACCAMREEAFGELTGAAQRLGANAVVGIDIDYEVLGEQNGMMMVAVSGTAIRHRLNARGRRTFSF